jgi:hypothetical protein
MNRRMAAAVAGVYARSAPKPDFMAFGGGLELVTPALEMEQPGFCRAAQNYECDVNGGYGRILGYERFDGRAKPSDANYAVLSITLTGAIAVGNTITGVTSAATAVVIAVPSGSLVITKISGTFVSGEILNVAAAPQATTTSAAIVDGASTPLLHAQYKNLAADQYRADIAAVPGSGNVLGVVSFAGVRYAFRNNIGATAAAIYKSSGTGWTAVTLYNELSFTAGSGAAPAEGATLTQGAVSATLKRIVLTSGSWAGANAAGRFIIANPSGGNFVAGAFTAGVAATASGVQTAITLSPSGQYEFWIENFGGAVNSRRIYGCDNVNRGFEFDGDVYVPITTGMTVDAPNHVCVHKMHLFFSFGASVQHAGPGTPYIWSVVLGANEIGMGDTVSGFMPQPGSEATGALAIYTRNRCSILYGTSLANWNLVPYRDELGAISGTIQNVGYTVFLDDPGVTNFTTTQAYGNFAHSALSWRIRTWMNTQRTKAISSCIVRDKSQYRLFFSDQYALFVTFNGKKVVGMMPIFLAHQVKCIWSAEESDGAETIFFGSTDGYVYQMEKGTSFDGADIEHYLHLVFNFSRSPRINKHYRKGSLEVKGSGYATFSFSYELGYADANIAQPGSETVTLSLAPGSWDTGSWDVGVWDGQTLVPSTVDMGGSAENVSLMLYGKSDYHASLRFSGAHLLHTPRKLLR